MEGEKERDGHCENAAGERDGARGVALRTLHDVAEHPLQHQEQRGRHARAGEQETDSGAEQKMCVETEVQNERREAVPEDLPRRRAGRVGRARADDAEDVVEQLRAAVVFEEGDVLRGVGLEIDAELAVLTEVQTRRAPLLDRGERAALGTQLAEGHRVVVEVAVQDVGVDPVLEGDLDRNRR